MRALRVPDVECGDARWATRDDIPALERYAAAYASERGSFAERDWVKVVDGRAVVVRERGDRIGSIVMRSGHTDRVACFGGTWTDPRYRRQGLSRQSVAFMMRALSETHSSVQLVVDDDNVAAIELYAALGFERTGRC